MKKIRHFLILTSCVLLMASCSDDFNLLSDVENFMCTDAIVFNTESQKDSRCGEYTMGSGFVLKGKETRDSLFVSTAISEIGEVTSRGAEINSESLTDFAVSCYIDKNDASAVDPEYLYFSQEEYTKNGTDWASSEGHKHYWLSKDFDYYFYAYGPIASENRTFTDNKFSKFDYTVPQSATNQEDLLAYYATTENSASVDPNAYYNQVVNLPFKHIMSEISIVQGSDMAIGSIYSVEISGFKGSGSYDIINNQWTLSGESDNAYTLNLTTNSVGTATNPGVSLSGVNKNFFILPQTVSAATLTVVYAGGDGVKKTFSAQLPETQFEQGKKYTYTININQDIEFEVLTGDYIDAHYDRFSVKITPKDLASGQSWTVGVGSTVSDATMLTADDYTTKDDYKLLREGYWTDKFTDGTSARGTSTLTFTGNTPQTIWVFVPENIGTAERKIPLTITINNRVVCTNRSVTQYCPYWNEAGSFGGEHIDTSQDIVWGFSWSGTETYTSDNFTLGLHWLDRLVYNSISSLVSGKSYITYTTLKAGLVGNTTYYESLTIHYDQITLENTAQSDDDGWQNTYDIYNFNGFGDLNTVVTTLQNNGYVSSSGGGTAINPSNSAALAVLKYCNKWDVIKETSTEGDTYTVKFLRIDWYLPAVNQCTSTTFTGGSGVYWTSSASPDSNVLSDTYTAPGGPSGSADRQSLHKVRAFRNKP